MLTLGNLAAEAQQLRPDMESLSSAIFEHPELAFNERFASASIAERLQARGFAVERPYGGLETSFAARVGTGGPHLGLLLEYDALPEIGHACGHNLIAAGGVLAASLIAEHLQAGSGRLSVIGTPAEEGGGGKVKLLDAGAFEGLDAVMMFHPADRTLPWRHALAAAHLRVQFHGKAAHAAKSPEQGRSALAAMLPPGARILGCY